MAPQAGGGPRPSLQQIQEEEKRALARKLAEADAAAAAMGPMSGTGGKPRGASTLGDLLGHYGQQAQQPGAWGAKPAAQVRFHNGDPSCMNRIRLFFSVLERGASMLGDLLSQNRQQAQQPGALARQDPPHRCVLTMIKSPRSTVLCKSNLYCFVSLCSCARVARTCWASCSVAAQMRAHNDEQSCTNQVCFLSHCFCSRVARIRWAIRIVAAPVRVHIEGWCSRQVVGV